MNILNGRKGTVWKIYLNSIIDRLKEAGIIDKWLRDEFKPQVTAKGSNQNKNPVKPGTLSLFPSYYTWDTYLKISHMQFGK